MLKNEYFLGTPPTEMRRYILNYPPIRVNPTFPTPIRENPTPLVKTLMSYPQPKPPYPQQQKKAMWKTCGHLSFKTINNHKDMPTMLALIFVLIVLIFARIIRKT